MQSQKLENSYKNLIVYQRSIELSILINKYFGNQKLNRAQEFVFIQLLRAVCSIGANISEGYGRMYKQNYRQFLSIARGSCFEVDYWLEILLRSGWFEKTKIENFANTNLEIIKMLSAMMKKLESKS